MLQVHAVAASEGLSRIDLTSSASRASVRNLYQSLGYRQVTDGWRLSLEGRP